MRLFTIRDILATTCVEIYKIFLSLYIFYLKEWQSRGMLRKPFDSLRQIMHVALVFSQET